MTPFIVMIKIVLSQNCKTILKMQYSPIYTCVQRSPLFIYKQFI
jgi:hypothetical protein